MEVVIHTAFSREVALFLVMLAFLSLTVLVATTIAGRLCRGRYRLVCYMLWLGLWSVLASMVGMSGFYIVGSLVMSGRLEANSLQMLLILSVYGGVVGAFLYLLNLPFMILAFVNPLFRERFSTSLRLEPVGATPEAILPDGIP